MTNKCEHCKKDRDNFSYTLPCQWCGRFITRPKNMKYYDEKKELALYEQGFKRRILDYLKENREMTGFDARLHLGDRGSSFIRLIDELREDGFEIVTYKSKSKYTKKMEVVYKYLGHKDDIKKKYIDSLSNKFDLYKEKFEKEKLDEKQNLKGKEDLFLLVKYFSEKENLNFPILSSKLKKKLNLIKEEIKLIKDCYHFNLKELDDKNEVVKKTKEFVNNDINHYDNNTQKFIDVVTDSLIGGFDDCLHLIIKANSLEEVKKLEELEELEKRKCKNRYSIPRNIKDEVWNRDAGKCVQCGSNEKLEFDHIIPHSKGGSNTYRNLQLLCEPCNRSKSNKIG